MLGSEDFKGNGDWKDFDDDGGLVILLFEHVSSFLVIGFLG